MLGYVLEGLVQGWAVDLRRLVQEGQSAPPDAEEWRRLEEAALAVGADVVRGDGGRSGGVGLRVEVMAWGRGIYGFGFGGLRVWGLRCDSMPAVEAGAGGCSGVTDH